MATCNLTAALALDCLDNVGGLKTLWISSDFDYTSVTADSTDGITAVTGGTGNFYQVEIPKSGTSFTENFNVSEENGTAFFEQTITIPVQKLSSAKREQIQLIAYNRATRCVVEDNNGVFWLLGLSRGCTLTAGTTTSGSALGDASGYNFTLTGQEPEMMYQVENLAALTGTTFVNA
jgi:hypothetical protein